MAGTIAYIDGQNLHLGTQSEGWNIDLQRFRIYLKDKFKIEKAYYYLGFASSEASKLYISLQEAGFILVFREHSEALKSKKKGNVDIDIVFDVMKRLYEEKDFDDLVLISGDGDYIKLVDHLIEKKKLKKIIFPNKHYSSLYKGIASFYGMNLSTKEIKQKMQYTKKRAS